MSNGRRLILSTLTMCAVLALAGCEWESSGEGSSWNDRYNWVSFTGVYKGANGGVLVTDFTSSSSGSGGTNTEVTVVRNERIETAREGISAYSGTLDNSGIVPGSVEITAGVFVLNDDGGGTLSGSGKVGSIDYGTGAWSIDLLGEWPPAGTPIAADYQYIGDGGGDGGGDDDDSGATGITIYQFVVEQTGNLISATDNNGSVYSGKLGSVRTTGGIDQDNVTPSTDTTSGGNVPVAGETVFADYRMTGTSKVGKHVTMIGTLQGTVFGSGNNISLAGRQMLGTWIEEDGKTGDVHGEAAPITINVTPTTTAANDQVL